MGAFGIPLNFKKLQAGTCLKWLGFVVDFESHELSTPSEKLNALQGLLGQVVNAKYCPRKILQRLLGKLVWVSTVFPHGKPFLQRSSVALKQPTNCIRLSKQLAQDLRMWWHLCGGDTKRIPACNVPLSSLTITADASLVGLGGLISSHTMRRADTPWFECPLTQEGIQWIFHDVAPKDTPAQHMVAALELLAILAAVVLYGPLLGNRGESVRVVIKTDSAAAQQVSAKWYARGEPLATVLRSLVIAAERANIRFQPEHLPGDLNTDADLISRNTPPTDLGNRLTLSWDQLRSFLLMSVCAPKVSNTI